MDLDKSVDEGLELNCSVDEESASEASDGDESTISLENPEIR